MSHCCATKLCIHTGCGAPHVGRRLHLPSPPPPASCVQARKHLEKSEVVDNDTGEGKPDSVRTSSGAFFGVAEDPVSFATATNPKT